MVVSLHYQKQTAMTTQENKYNLKPGDQVTFTNKKGYGINKVVSRVEEKSVYWDGKWRESWNTCNTIIEKYNAKIDRA
jgi:plastocyanin